MIHVKIDHTALPASPRCRQPVPQPVRSTACTHPGTAQIHGHGRPDKPISPMHRASSRICRCLCRRAESHGCAGGQALGIRCTEHGVLSLSNLFEEILGFLDPPKFRNPRYS